ncbi:hypothetical protein [Agrobacterium tumefaciens]|uniref:hypothetical protein n=1 Tax=Agrobacterium tumefaciens TaxID=358 RepID=UPI003BA3B132
MFERFKIALVAVGGVVAGGLAMYVVAAVIMVPAAKQEARNAALAEMAIASVKAESERKGDDSVLQTKTDYELCVLGLRTNGLPVDACEQLRGLVEE